VPQGKRQQGYNDSTLHKRVRLLRQFLRNRRAPGIDLQDDDTKALHKLMLTTPVTLSLVEIEALGALDLRHIPRLDRVRDLAILQAFCGLRWSDLTRLETRFIQNGFISIFMKKSASDAIWVHIPVFAQSKRILCKYTNINGTLALPKITDQKFNNYFKEICQLVPALLEEHVQDYRLRGSLMVLRQAKYEYLSSHSLRRTFVTICLDLGFNAQEVMGWSGHKTWAAFQRYIGSTGQRRGAASEHAQRWEATMVKREVAAVEYTSSIPPQPPIVESSAANPVGNNLSTVLSVSSALNGR
jgi:integrase